MSDDTRLVHNPEFHFTTPTGEPFSFDVASIEGFTATRDRRGRIVVRFPKPYEDIAIREHEQLGMGKWLKAKKAIAALTREEQ
jgi:hypothetical protein